VGEHENYKLGRVLRNITFSGKGFVNKPANPESIIFSKSNLSDTLASLDLEKNTIFDNKGVITNQSHENVENNIMSSETKASEQTVETPVAETTENVVTQDAQSAINMDELKSAMMNKTQELEALKKTYEGLKMQKEEEMATMQKQQEEMAMMMNKMKSELSEAQEVIAAYKTKEEEMMKKEKKMKRMASLVEAGIDSESAEATVDKFESLTDEAFEAMTSLVAGKMPPWLNKDNKDKKKKEDDSKATDSEASKEETEANVDPEVLETAEVEANVNLGIGGDAADPVESTRAALVEFVSSRLGKNYK
jgi:hypothetical protein